MKKEKRKPRTASGRSNSRRAAAVAPRPSEGDKDFCVVGIGASAGGLEALEKFFDHLPADSGLAFVIIQHLNPDHKSMMAEILERHTPMKVLEAQDGVRIKPNAVYIIPPNKLLSISGGALHLDEAAAPRFRLPIDTFFRSLAEDKKDKSICIVLSGTGSDGALGLKAVKEAGGMTMAQEESSAKHNNMPRSAIATGCVDFVLRPEEMPGQLIKYIQHPYVIAPAKTDPSEEKGMATAIEKVFMLLRSYTGHDFSCYKRNTINRRIERRMALHQIDQIGYYLSYLEKNKSEIELLFREFLIGVTRLFRDPEAFEALREKVITPLFQSQDPELPLRVWVAGCSTGEEAYTVAIVLQEEADRRSKALRAQIFATDIDAGALETARTGIYPDSIAADVSPGRLKRFFSKEGNFYRIKKEVRELVVFAKQDLIKDPPFSRLDLIVCRNLLIYFGPVLQKKVLPLFHYVLNPGRFLMLGPSETVGEFDDLFFPIDKKWKIFQYKSVPRFTVNIPVPQRAKVPLQLEKAKPPRSSESNVVQVTESILLEEYAPSYVIINEKYEIIHFRGKTGRYLEPSTGEATFNILKLAKNGLRIELRTAIHKAFKTGSTVVHPNIKIKENGKRHRMNLVVKPLERDDLGMMIVIFDEGKMNLPLQEDSLSEGEALQTDQRVLDLEQELNSTKESLQTAIEELETSNEELKSTNEELQSTNEELQSTNEELETSKEELQSINEELVTVNSELQSKLDELANASNDMLNLLSSTEIATVFLDNNLKVKRFTPASTEVMNLMPTDIDRPVGGVFTYLANENLAHDAEEVLKKLVFKEKEVRTQHGRWYRMRIAPYRTLDNMIDGVVIVFINITEFKNAAREVQAALQYADNIIATIREPLLVLNKKLRVVSANDAYYHTFHRNEGEVIGQLVYSLGNGESNLPALKRLFEEILTEGTTIEDYEVSYTLEKIGFRKMSLNARKIRMASNVISQEDELILLAIQDRTERE